MRNWISIDGIHLTQYGLQMAKLPLWPSAAETVENTVIPGAPVEIGRHTGQYSDFSMTLTGYLTNYPYNLPKINRLLQTGKKLIMSTQPHLYGVIRSVGQIAPSRIGTLANELQIPFVFEPFKYSTQNYPLHFGGDKSPINIQYFGNFYAEPVYRLTVDPEMLGAAFFTVNGVTVTILNPAIQTGTVIIDIPRKKIYTEQGGVLTIAQEFTTGNFWECTLNPGDNTISWNDHVTAVEITKNERWL